MLVIFGGLPGTGKTTLARGLAQKLGGVHVRVDTIEQAILAAAPDGAAIGEQGYRVAYAVAEDNLRLGRPVIADSVNPLQVTRVAWRSVAKRAGVAAAEVEVVCRDEVEHRRRVETRGADIQGHKLPTWRNVMAHGFEPWAGDHLVITTAGRSVEQSLATIVSALAGDRHP